MSEPTPTKQYPGNYSVKVIVEYNFEVEADDAEQAEAIGWYYENYAYSAEVYSIEVDEDEVFCQECGEQEHDGACEPDPVEEEEEE